jgi:hypothetical protein
MEDVMWHRLSLEQLVASLPLEVTADDSVDAAHE